jgi:curved DNA-binding protein CbpA
MSDPYEIMALPPTASENEIRQRYLELVRAHPPDRAPEQFAAINAAYAELRDPVERLEKQIFGLEYRGDSIETIVADLRKRLRKARLPVDSFMTLADPL